MQKQHQDRDREQNKLAFLIDIFFIFALHKWIWKKWGNFYRKSSSTMNTSYFNNFFHKKNRKNAFLAFLFSGAGAHRGVAPSGKDAFYKKTKIELVKNQLFWMISRWYVHWFLLNRLKISQVLVQKWTKNILPCGRQHRRTKKPKTRFFSIFV